MNCPENQKNYFLKPPVGVDVLGVNILKVREIVWTAEKTYIFFTPQWGVRQAGK